MVEREARTGRQGRRSRQTVRIPARKPDYRRLVNTLMKQKALSDDRIEAIHEAALRVLEELGIKVLNDQARALFKRAGASVDPDTWMVRIDRGLVAEALEAAPSEFDMVGGSPDRTVRMGGDSVAFVCVGGPPHASDLDRGKRPSTLEDSRNFMRLSQHFDVIHLQSPSCEAQDIDVTLRHLSFTESQLSLSDKPLFIFARGTEQVRDGFEMTRIVRGVSDNAFADTVWCYTVINTNSPRQLDLPMCQGIIDFAEAGQASVITPFTLAGAMAPVSIAGALTLQHAEALSGIVLAQIVRKGAPVVYGSFTSNVDMKSGAPAFGTPEYVKAAIAGGQLARHIGLPWRGSSPNASNAPDEQSMHETAMSAWGSMLGGVNMMLHSAGWLEGGLTASLEKFILDVEMLQSFAEIFQPLDATETEIGFDAIAAVEPGGHFFGSEHTMERYETAFYEPLVSDWRNFGQWTEAGGLTASQRANGIWKSILGSFEAPPMDPGRREEMDAFIERRTREGGAPPMG
ncbi:MAG: trimethylamine methyltransferase family protein [Pseudomonadota bacterium]